MVCGGGMLSLRVTKTDTRSSVNLENYSPVTSILPWIGFSSCGGSWTQTTVMETDATSHLTIFDCDSFCALIANDTVLSYTSASCLMKKEAPVTGEMGKKSFQSRSLAHELSRDQTRNQWYDPRYFWQYLRGWQQLHLTWTQTYHGLTNSDMRLWHALILRFAYCLDLWTNCSWMFPGPSLIFHRRAAQKLSDFQNTSKNVLSLDGICF